VAITVQAVWKGSGIDVCTLKNLHKVELLACRCCAEERGGDLRSVEERGITVLQYFFKIFIHIFVLRWCKAIKNGDIALSKLIVFWLVWGL